MKKKKFLSKSLIIVFIVFGFGTNLFAGFTILSDFGTKTCTVEGITQAECDNDIQCTASRTVCKIALDNFGGILEAEAIGQIIKYGGQGAVYASKKLANLGFSNSKSITTELLGKVGNAMKNNSGIKKAKGLSPNEIAKVFSEIVFSIAVDTYVDHLPQASFDSVRSSGIPGFSGASNDVIKISMKRLIMLAKNNFIFLMSANKITAARDAIVADGLILAEIGVDVANSSVEATESSLALAKSEKIGEIFELYIDYRKIYFIDSRKQHHKYSIVSEFETQCAEIKLTGLESFWASLNRGGYSLSTINGGLRSRCSEYSMNIQEDERTKYKMIKLSTYFPEDRYDKIVELYFPPSEHYKLKSLYNILNYDLDLRVSKNSASRKYIQKFLAYGFTIEDLLYDNILFEPDHLIEEYRASNMVFYAYITLYPDKYPLPVEWEDRNAGNINEFKRKDFAKLLKDSLDLHLPINRLFIGNPNPNSINLSASWTEDAKTLKSLGIIKGYSNFDDFRPEDNISMFEVLVMTINAMDYIKCGHVGCEISEILGVQ